MTKEIRVLRVKAQPSGEMMKEKKKWYPLDTSAKIYPAIESIRYPALFRVSIQLNEPVEEKVLIIALEKVKQRFPYFQVALKNGLFWKYLEQNDKQILIWQDTPSPCERIYPNFNHGFLYKIKVFENNIALELSHVLSDGYGAMEFLKCLVFEYLVTKGEKQIRTLDVMNIFDPVDEEEYQDAFFIVKQQNPDKPKIDKERSLFSSLKSYQIQSRLLSIGSYKVITGIMDIAQLKKVAKIYDVTITQLVASLYLEALIHLQDKQIKNKKEHKNVSVQIPVNMRNIYKTKCMRNFSLFVIPTIDPREVSKFEDIVQRVKEHMDQHLSKKYLLLMIHENCELAKNVILMHVPSVIKNLVISYVTNTQGATQYSGTLSNLGVVKMPDTMKAHVKSARFYLGPTHEKCTCSMLGFGGKINLSFSKSIQETDIERHVFRRLVAMGVDVELISNY